MWLLVIVVFATAAAVAGDTICGLPLEFNGYECVARVDFSITTSAWFQVTTQGATYGVTAITFGTQLDTVQQQSKDLFIDIAIRHGRDVFWSIPGPYFETPNTFFVPKVGFDEAVRYAPGVAAAQYCANIDNDAWGANFAVLQTINKFDSIGLLQMLTLHISVGCTSSSDIVESIPSNSTAGYVNWCSDAELQPCTPTANGATNCISNQFAASCRCTVVSFPDCPPCGFLKLQTPTGECIDRDTLFNTICDATKIVADTLGPIFVPNYEFVVSTDAILSCGCDPDIASADCMTCAVTAAIESDGKCALCPPCGPHCTSTTCANPEGYFDPIFAYHVCDVGYTGGIADCDSCEPGYAMDEVGKCIYCHSNGCLHGSVVCEIVGTSSSMCVCDAPWEGPQCDAQRLEHGLWSAYRNTHDCDVGYAGSTCDDCARGYTRNEIGCVSYTTLCGENSDAGASSLAGLCKCIGSHIWNKGACQERTVVCGTATRTGSESLPNICLCLHGYHFYPEFGMCMPMNCGPGQDTPATIASDSCVCLEGYILSQNGICDACADGFYGRNCRQCMTTCGPNEECVQDEYGNELCLCIRGWQRANGHCGECADGFMGDGCIECYLQCGEHGVCAVEHDIPVCLCAHGFYSNAFGYCNVCGGVMEKDGSCTSCSNGQYLSGGSCICHDGYDGVDCRECAFEFTATPSCRKCDRVCPLGDCVWNSEITKFVCGVIQQTYNATTPVDVNHCPECPVSTICINNECVCVDQNSTMKLEMSVRAPCYEKTLVKRIVEDIIVLSDAYDVETQNTITVERDTGVLFWVGWALCTCSFGLFIFNLYARFLKRCIDGYTQTSTDEI